MSEMKIDDLIEKNNILNSIEQLYQELIKMKPCHKLHKYQNTLNKFKLCVSNFTDHLLYPVIENIIIDYLYHYLFIARMSKIFKYKDFYFSRLEHNDISENIYDITYPFINTTINICRKCGNYTGYFYRSSSQELVRLNDNMRCKCIFIESDE